MKKSEKSVSLECETPLWKRRNPKKNFCQIQHKRQHKNEMKMQNKIK